MSADAPLLLVLGWLALALPAAVHALLHARSPEQARAWVVVVLLVPALGPVLYLLFGLNRIQRRARRLRRGVRRLGIGEPRPTVDAADPRLRGLTRLVPLGERLSAGRPLRDGNDLTLFGDAPAALAAMLAAIDGATRSVALATYIFEHDALGARFVEALCAAARRGVAVRVLVDAAGLRFAPRSVVEALVACGVPAARFLPPGRPRLLRYLNLRNHRKLLVVDGAAAFIGGTNLTGEAVPSPDGPPVLRDLHAAVRGPVVADIFAVWAEDWAFSTGETLAGPAWAPAPTDPAPADPALCRVVEDGPDEDVARLERLFIGALATARSRVCLLTPYLLPGPALRAALEVAALRGVRVDIAVPADPDHPVVRRAMAPILRDLARWGCHVVETPVPFDHAKLLVVDARYVVLGSANWDPRSFHLNFEAVLEVWCPRAGAAAEALAEARFAHGRRVAALPEARVPVPQRLLEGVCGLFSPLL